MNKIYLYIYMAIIFIIYILVQCKNKTLQAIGFVCSMLGAAGICLYTTKSIQAFLNPITIIVFIGVGAYIFKKVYKKGRNISYTVETYDDLQTLNRDIDAHYSPSIVGYLCDQKLKYKDLIADIMNLYAEKIISLQRIEKDQKVSYKIIIEDENYESKVCRSDAYILQTLGTEEKDKKFQFQVWSELVKNRYRKLGFIRENNNNSFNIYVLVTCVCALIGGIYSYIALHSIGMAIMYTVLGALVGVIGCVILSNVIQKNETTDMFLSQKGKDELKKWIKFKRFISGYTLLNQRTVEEIVLFEKYIPYAVVLKVNVTYKNTKFDIFTSDEWKQIIEESSFVKDIEDLGVTFD